MELTIEQIKEAAGKQPQLKEGILGAFQNDFRETATKSGLIIRTKEEDQQYVQNTLDQVLPARVEEKFSSKFKESLDGMDAEILRLTGIDKRPAEKTTDYAKRAFQEYHDKGGDPVTKQKVSELETLLEKTKQEYDQRIKESAQKIFEKEQDFQINGDLEKRNIAIPPHLKTDEDKQAYINQQKALIRQGFLSTYKGKQDDQGNIVYYDGEKPLLDTKTGKPRSAGDLIGERFANWFVPAGRTVTGTGAEGDRVVLPADGFKNVDDIHKYLAASGEAAGTSSYLTQLQKLAKDSNIDL